MSPNALDAEQRYFLTYRGVALPLALAEEIDLAAVRNRGTYFRASYAAGRIVLCEKLVYGDIEMKHEYEYDAGGRLRRATITTPDEEPQVLSFSVE